MALKSKILSLFAQHTKRATRKSALNAIAHQEKWRNKLISKAKHTKFGVDHHFDKIKSAQDFSQSIPIRNYEDLRPYIDKLLDGQVNTIWPGSPKYLAKTSGTTSGIKYIPLSTVSIKQHIKAARNAIFNYVAQSKAPLFEGKMIFISGSPELSKVSDIPTGRLSGIVNHEVPSWIRTNQLPTYKTNCIDDWETKLDKIVEETYGQDLRLISGIPPWVQMYYERLLVKTGCKTIKEIFPNLSVFIHGGVNFAPYKATMDRLHGSGVDTIETYPASEGFIAYQDDYKDEGLLLNTDAGMYFEFIPLSEIGLANPTRLPLAEVEIDIDYALILSTSAGLWAYNIGDCIRFVQLHPFKIKVSGRIKHFISAFGEHVIAKEVEQAITEVNLLMGLSINEFTVAPQINPPDGSLPYHEWFIEFDQTPEDVKLIAQHLNESIVNQNIYYKDLIVGKVLRPLIIKPLPKNSFINYMKSIGKLGGQNKVPRLMNDRTIADRL